MISISPHPPIDVPDMSYADHLLARIDSFGDKAALVDARTGTSITYGELARRARAAAAGIAMRDVGQGDVIGILSANDCAYPIAVLASLLRGASVSPIAPQSTQAELKRQLELCGAETLIASNDLVELGRAAGAKRVFSLNPSTPLNPSTQCQWFEEPGDFGEVAYQGSRAEGIALLPFSSGTTGLPKGVTLTHRNLIANLEQLSVVDDLSADDTILALLPFFHIYGLTFALGHSLFNGATVVVMDRFDPDLFVDAFDKFKITRAPLAPPLISFLVNSPLVEGRDFSALKVLMTGAAALDPSTSRACSRRLQVTIRQGYGMTETCSVTHINWSDPDLVQEGTIGVLLPNTEARIVDPKVGNDCETGEVGELWVRGPQVMPGYYRNDTATQATITPDKWLRTGDLASVSSDGQFRIVGRLKELIKYKGHQVSPGELEEIILSIPGAADAAVVGQPHPEFGELPIAFVVAAGLNEADLIDFVSEQVSPFKKLRGVRFVEAIPRSASGKILRQELVRQLCDELEGELQ